MVIYGKQMYNISEKKIYFWQKNCILLVLLISLNEFHHMVLAAGKSNNKTYTFHEMLKQDDAADFIKAMQKEADDHASRGHWQIVKRSEIPAGVKTIQAI